MINSNDLNLILNLPNLKPLVNQLCHSWIAKIKRLVYARSKQATLHPKLV